MDKYNNIVLIGFMGCGKSSVGRELQKKTGYLLLDSDHEIENEQNRKISEIFATDGEKAFRRLEADYLEKLAVSGEHLILSTGGGMPLLKENADRMKKVGKVVYLKAQPETIYKRVEYDTTRPLLQTGDKMTIISQMLEKRGPIYESAADVIVETDGKNFDQIVEEIINETSCN